jgi:hypothetical protein
MGQTIMVEVGATSFRLEAPPMSRDELRSYSTKLFDEWDARLSPGFAIEDYSLRLEIEEGSVEGLAVVGATVVALYTGVSKYPSFVAGLQKIQSHVRLASDHLVARASEPFTRLNLRPRVTRRSGVPGQLERLFARVKARELSVEEAMRDAERILGADSAQAAELLHALAKGLVAVKRNPEQLILPMELPADIDERESKPVGVRKRARGDSAVASPHFKVEVWRDSRSGKREIRISEV